MHHCHLSGVASPSSGLPFEFMADLNHNLASCLLDMQRLWTFLFFYFLSPRRLVSSVHSHVDSPFSLSTSAPFAGWKEPSADHQRLAAAGTSPLTSASFFFLVWSQCANCHFWVYFWKLLFVLCPSGSAIHIISKRSLLAAFKSHRARCDVNSHISLVVLKWKRSCDQNDISVPQQGSMWHLRIWAHRQEWLMALKCLFVIKGQQHSG